jgi:hypothetical protein
LERRPRIAGSSHAELLAGAHRIARARGQRLTTPATKATSTARRARTPLAGRRHLIREQSSSSARTRTGTTASLPLSSGASDSRAVTGRRRGDEQRAARQRNACRTH